jgi:hypothetical protein
VALGSPSPTWQVKLKPPGVGQTVDTSMLRICQWNVLLDSSLPGCIDEAMRNYVELPEILVWSYRQEIIAGRINESQADVVLLEECSPKMLKDLTAKLPVGVFGAYHASDIDTGPDTSELDVAILIRLSTLELKSPPKCQRLHELCSEATRPIVLHEKHDGDIKPTSYVLLSAAILLKGHSDVIVIGGTHLRWEFGTMSAAPARAPQACAAARGLLLHASEAGAVGWALCGDFNSGPADEAYRALTDGSLQVADCNRPAGDAAFVSAFRAVHGAEPRFTRKKNSPDSEFCLDYAFIGGRLAAVAARVGPLDTAGGGEGLPSLPCAEWPSDHLPLFVTLELRGEDMG